MVSPEGMTGSPWVLLWQASGGSGALVCGALLGSLLGYRVLPRGFVLMPAVIWSSGWTMIYFTTPRLLDV